MKVLKDNYNRYCEEEVNVTNSYPRKMICGACGSELEYEESDVRVGALGCAVVDCPLCCEDNIIDDSEKAIELTADNVEFPTHFWHTSKENGAVDCCNNDEIKKCVRKAIDYFRKNKDEFCWYTEYGNLYVEVRRYDGDENYDVTVSNDYYNTYINFEPEDYA